MSPEKILILKPDNIGDVLLFSGALKQIRELYPQAHINLAVQKQVLNLFELCPYLDGCVAVDDLTWWGKPEPRGFFLEAPLKRAVLAMNRLWHRATGAPDLLIFPVKSPQLHQLQMVDCLAPKKSYGVAGCTLNTPRDGFSFRLRPPVLFTDCFDVSSHDPWQHELQFNADFLRFLGCRDLGPEKIAPDLWLSEQDSRLVPALRQPGRQTVALFPGAAVKIRCWDPANYGELAARLQHPVTYAVFGSPGDRVLAAEVEAAIKARCPLAIVVNLAGQTTLREVAASIGHCHLFIGAETSGLHLAIAAGIPTVGIVGGGHFGRFVPWGDPARNLFLTKKLECFNCNWICSKGEPACISEVTPQQVAEAAATLLTAAAGDEPC